MARGIWFDNICFTQVSISPGAISANTSSEVTFAMSGDLRTTDVVLSIVKPTLTAGIDIGNFRVSAANTIKVTFQNSTGSPITPATETYIVVVARPELPLTGSDALSGGSVLFK